MRRSESITALAKALVLAKQKMEAPTKNKTAKIGEKFGYQYADLSGVKDAYQSAIGAQGLGIIHALAPVDGHVVLTTTLLHESGEWIASDYPIQSYSKPQEQGSALTYFKRYNVCALLDIVAEDDDDGKAAQDAAGKAPEKKAAPAPPSAPKADLTNEEIVGVQTLAKQRGFLTPAALAPVLGNILPGVSKASDIQRKDLRAVMDALTAMREKVVA